MPNVESGAGLARLMELVGPRVGLIRQVGPVQRGADHPRPPFIYHATLAHFDHRTAPASERESAGTGSTEAEAMGAAIGEALERYCAAHIDPQVTRQRSWSDMAVHAIAPPDCVLYSERQYARRDFPYHRWEPTAEVTWVPMRELPGGNEVFVPASLVYLRAPSLRREDHFTTNTSNGLAAGSDVESAILRGLYELVERDAFLITWMARLPAAEVDFSSDRGVAQSIRAHYARFAVELRVFRLCTDVPLHAMMAIALDRSGEGPAAVIGLGCQSDPTRAVLKALFETCQILPGERQRYRARPPAARLHSARDVKTLEDHSAYLAVPERTGEFAFLLENGRTVNLEELPNYSGGSTHADLDHCVGALRRVGCRVLYANLTTPDLRGYPIKAVRTIATGLQPMHFGYGEERLGGRRLFEVPHKLGFAPGPLAEGDLNPCPHPLA
jgi:ribosomal protein S12 methylthiotransferase accessory factor